MAPTMVKQNEDKASFTDLAAELRNRVYHLVLVVAPDSIHLQVHTRNGVEHVIVAHPFRLPNVSILLACQVVHQEATPILYGANIFVNHAHPRVFPLFQQIIGTSGKFIRRISLRGEYAVEVFRKSISSLERLEALCEVRFYRYTNSFFRSEDIAKILGRVMQAILARREDGDVEEVLAMLTFKPMGSRITEEDEEIAEEAEWEVKGLLREMMERSSDGE